MPEPVRIQRLPLSAFLSGRTVHRYAGAGMSPIKETIRGFKEILEGKYDDIPESAFLFAGGIEDVLEKAKQA